MKNVNSLIAERLKNTEPSKKMAAMAAKSAMGELTTFSGLFQIQELSFQERAKLEEILTAYSNESHLIDEDLKTLITLTAEVKAINHQAALLHGERILKAHDLLTNYQEGAFTAWLIATYGNRQTPYNLMQYHVFYTKLPEHVRELAEKMPRQILYTLASRQGELKQKIDLIVNYSGETKTIYLRKIRDSFPLALQDKRRENIADQAIKWLEKGVQLFSQKSFRLSERQRKELKQVYQIIGELLKK